MNARTTISALIAVACQVSAALAEETVVTLQDGIIGTLALPNGGAHGPAVVMLHGFASSRDEVGGLFSMQAASLAKAGVASIRIDFRGYGESAGSEAGVTVERMIEDAAIARAYLASVDGVDATRVGVLGYSFGAAIAMLGQEDYAAMAVWGQMGDLRGEFLDFLGQDAFEAAAATGNYTTDLGWRVISLDQPFFESLGRHDLAATFAGFDGPFLTVAGDADPAVAHLERFADLADGEAAVKVIPGTDHMFGVFSDEPEIGARLVAETTAWFEAEL